MNKVFKLFSFLFLLVTYHLLTPQPVLAVCPVCTVAVGAGLGLARVVGIDDTVSGIWVGGLILSSALWMADFLHKRNKKYDYNIAGIVGALVMFALVILPLWFTGVMGHPDNKIIGVDKLLFGTIVGIGVFLAALWTDKKVRKIKGHQLFIYQKVVFPVSFLVTMSLVLYLLTKKP